jgi:subtilisin family serine protease
MKLKFLPALFSVLSFFTSFAQTDGPIVIPGQYIVTIKDAYMSPVVLSKNTTEGSERDITSKNADGVRDQKITQMKAIRSAAGVSEVAVLANYVDGLCGFSVKADARQAELLLKNPAVESVTPDYLITLEPSELEAEYTETESGAQVTSCAITNAGGSANGSTKTSIIWILDTGIDLDHPDLNVLSGANYQKSFIAGETPDDGQGHGTHVAGIAGAKNNTFGSIGVSAGAKLAAIKVLSNAGAGSLSAMVAGLDHVAKYCKANDVLNISIGAYPVILCAESSTALTKVFNNLSTAKTWICVAAGNNGCDAAKSRPGCFNGTRLLTVGSMNCDLTCSSFSNWNKTVVDWVASGSNIYSTFKNGGYAKLSGTSMATPVVAGICHALGTAPVSGGLINCGNDCTAPANYKKAKRQ